MNAAFKGKRLDPLDQRSGGEVPTHGLCKIKSRSCTLR
jgi:hypothetical protein